MQATGGLPTVPKGIVPVAHASAVVKRARTDALLSGALKGIKDKVEGSGGTALLELRLQELEDRRLERREAAARDREDREDRRKEREQALERELLRMEDARAQRTHELKLAEMERKSRQDDERADREQARQLSQFMALAIMRMTGAIPPAQDQPK